MKVSPACKNCYAETLSHRWGFDIWGPTKPRRELSETNWKKPFGWNKQAAKSNTRLRVFCGSMCDWAEDLATLNPLRERLFSVIRETPSLDWLLLTKRADNIANCLPSDWGSGYPNVWLGTTVESNDWVWRADELRLVPAVVRFVSYEPALGPLDQLSLDGLQWVIYGGESATAKHLRRDNDSWALDMLARCEAAGVTFHYKQNSATPGKHSDTLQGQSYKRWPLPLAS